ncbi:hypothetical protein VPHD51_0146 [Vibrio phage D51]
MLGFVHVLVLVRTWGGTISMVIDTGLENKKPLLRRKPEKLQRQSPVVLKAIDYGVRGITYV